MLENFRVSPLENTSSYELPPTSKVWPDPLIELKSNGDQSPDAIYHAVGLACSHWEKLESSLARFFSLFVTGGIQFVSEGDAALRAYGAIASSASRLNMLRNAVLIYSDRLQLAVATVKHFPTSDFVLLLDHVGKASRYRNEIVHGHVQHFFTDGKDRGFFLTPPIYMASKNKAPLLDRYTRAAESAKAGGDELEIFIHKYRYISSDILHLANQFSWLETVSAKIFGQHFEQLIKASMPKV